MYRYLPICVYVYMCSNECVHMVVENNYLHLVGDPCGLQSCYCYGDSYLQVLPYLHLQSQLSIAMK